MLHNMLLEGFRSFEEPTTLPFGKLTLIAGANNVGKSSVIQALLAFVQSGEVASKGQLLLSGSWCDVGPFEQVVSANLPAERRAFSIGLTGTNRYGEVDCLWTFDGPKDPSLPTASIANVNYTVGNQSVAVQRMFDGSFQWSLGSDDDDGGGWDATFASTWHVVRFWTSGSLLDHLSVVDGRANYIGPFRAPPQPLYTPRTSPIGPPLGRYGEHTAEVLFRSRASHTDVLIPGASETDRPLLSAVNAWWSYIFDGKLALQIDAPARLGFTLAIDTPSAERLGLGQVGLGLSQSLPIIAASLVSHPDDFLIFETPEAHLHPGAQHRLTHLFIELARRGRQVVVETHSEHVINAVRLAVKDGLLSRDDVSILFFEQEDGRTVFQKIDLDPQGRALKWPAGFFDQASKDLADLMR